MLTLLFCLERGEGGTPALAWLGGGYPSTSLEGTPVPTGGATPVLSWPGGGGGYPSPLLGLGYLPGWGTPGKDLGPEAWERTWGCGTPRKDRGPETWERTRDWGTPQVWTDTHLWTQYTGSSNQMDRDPILVTILVWETILYLLNLSGCRLCLDDKLWSERQQFTLESDECARMCSWVDCANTNLIMYPSIEI